MQDIVIEVLKNILPAMVVFAAAYMVLSSLLSNQLEMKQTELGLELQKIKQEQARESLPIRLQAYERLILFLERIQPQNLILRANQDQTTSPEMQMALVMTIRLELEHNISQQIYVSSEAWGSIKAITEEMIGVVNSIGSTMPSEASGTQLARKILEYYQANQSISPTYYAAEQLKNEVRQLLG